MIRLTCEDWCHVPRDRMAALYAAETERWASVLEWDSAADWVEVEQGRLLGTVDGVVVTDDRNQVVAWSYYLIHRGTLQIGGFRAASEAASQMMLDAIMTDDVLAKVEGVTFFAFTDAPDLGAALRRRGMAVERYWYLGRDLTKRWTPALRDARRWRVDDAPATAELLARAYPGEDASRPFAPSGSAAEWSWYVQQLTQASGCGQLVPEACVAVPAGPSRLGAAVLVTRVSNAAAHVAQLVVDPQLRRQGTGGALVGIACEAAARAGFPRITLLVGGRNRSARQLYEGARFQPIASFVSAGFLQPRLSTSVASGGDAIARR